MTNQIKRQKLLFYVFLLSLSLISTGCAAPAPEKDLKLYFLIITNKDEYGNGGKCATGLEVADYFTANTKVSIYDNSTGDQLAVTRLDASDDKPGYRDCTYRGTATVPKVSDYRFVFGGGRSESIRSYVDLRTMANEVDSEGILGDLIFVLDIEA